MARAEIVWAGDAVCGICLVDPSHHSFLTETGGRRIPGRFRRYGPDTGLDVFLLVLERLRICDEAGTSIPPIPSVLVGLRRRSPRGQYLVLTHALGAAGRGPIFGFL